MSQHTKYVVITIVSIDFEQHNFEAIGISYTY